jgi:hypothetical protein
MHSAPLIPPPPILWEGNRRTEAVQNFSRTPEFLHKNRIPPTPFGLADGRHFLQVFGPSLIGRQSRLVPEETTLPMPISRKSGGSLLLWKHLERPYERRWRGFASDGGSWAEIGHGLGASEKEAERRFG